MKDKLKGVYFWIITIIQTVVSILLILFFSRFRAAKKISKLKIDRKGRCISLIAGGPSTKEILTSRCDLLDQTDLVVVNFFGNTDDFFKYKPKYYVLLDPTFFYPNFANKGLNEASTENKKRVQVNKLLENLGKVDWNMTLFIPYINDLSFINNPFISVIEFNTTRVVGFDRFQNWMYRHNQGLPNSRNVITPAMLLMINLGYKDIYLYGCEFSWTKTMDVDPENGRFFFNDSHFYNKSEFRYFDKGAFHWWLDSMSEYLTGVEQIAKYAVSEDVKIVNRTKGSFIDCFEYENIDRIES